VENFRVVHYLNQFFAGIGGEDQADMSPAIREGCVGPGLSLDRLWQGQGKIVATVICGDNYFSTNPEATVQELLPLIEAHHPDVVIAGPAFASGRYGLSCGYLCRAVVSKLRIPCVTSMEPENPGVQEAKGLAYIISASDRVARMGRVLPKVARLAAKLACGQSPGAAQEEGYLPRGYRLNTLRTESGAVRAVNMLLAKMNKHSFMTEIPLPQYDQVTAAAPLETGGKIRLALVTESGLVPEGNPDHLESSRATKWLKYPIPGEKYVANKHYSLHGGYDVRFVNADPNRVVPLDAVATLVREGVIGEVCQHYYVTTGMAAPIARATKFGSEIAHDLLQEGVNMVIVTST